MTTFESRWQMTVEAGHCDPAGMVFAKRLFEYFDTGTWSLFEAALGIKRQDFPATSIIMPLVDVNLECQRPVLFGDVIEIVSRVIEFRRSSFQVEHRITVAGELAIIGTEMRVWAERDRLKPEKISARVIPDDVVARFG